jgi:hypothetical protein
MYADGDGVKRDDLRAFEYFRGIADAYADEAPDTPQGRFVASAFVALGNYYLDGIPDTAIKPDARELFAYAASYFAADQTIILKADIQLPPGVQLPGAAAGDPGQCGGGDPPGGVSQRRELRGCGDQAARL